MLSFLGWIVAALLFAFLCIIWWSWQRHAEESLAQSEFISILFLDDVIYANNRKVYLDSLNEMPREGHWAARALGASTRAKNMALTFIAKAGGINQVLGAILEEYWKARWPSKAED